MVISKVTKSIVFKSHNVGIIKGEKYNNDELLTLYPKYFDKVVDPIVPLDPVVQIDDVFSIDTVEPIFEEVNEVGTEEVNEPVAETADQVIEVVEEPKSKRTRTKK